MKRLFTMILGAILLLTGLAAIAGAETKNPHGDIKWDCQKCHTPDSWTEMRKPLTFAHDETDFPLIGAHRVTRCAGCHRDLVFSHVASACGDCHSDPHKGQMGLACQKCHTSENWQNREDVFNLHMQKGFALSGVHAIADCNSCHQGQRPEAYATTPLACQGCHMADFTGAVNPSHVKAGFRFDCETCHSPQSLSWRMATYEHPLPFRLEGAHHALDCNSCHASTFAGTPNTCFGCHESNFKTAADPNHVLANFDHDCSTCHTTLTWSPASFDHSHSRFALTGAHVTVACNLCHKTGYTGTTTSCDGCHHADFAKTTKPNHVTGGFPTDCQTCHTTVVWSPANFDHNRTRFALTGAHSTVTCDKCHATGYTATSTQCYSCHQTSFTAAADPNHVLNKFEHTCEQCHSTAAWSPAVFDHSQTRFPLTGAHQTLACAQCHSAGYANTPTNCYSCHQQTFAGVKDPNHVSDAFDHDCLKCHTTAKWAGATFDHNLSRFVLTGAHQTVTCNMCHKPGFDGTASACVACHQTQFAGTTRPDHIAGGFPTECQVCHNTTAWSPSNFDHSKTLFPLTGAHSAVVCGKCHAAGYAGTSTACYSCHQTNYIGVKNPDHVLGNFEHDCLKCHTVNSYKPSTFDHGTTRFALTGAHQTVACNQCHATTFAGTATTCYGCHQTTYASVKDPNHAAGNFDHDCQKCHTTVAWKPASFDHNLARFVLTGAHQSVACAQCHVTGFTGTASDCYSCHQTNYVGVKDPNHVTNNFDHNCLKCHTTTAWLPVSFDHSGTSFPLTGAHTAVSCNTCHKTGFAGTASTCYACHQAAFTGTTSPNHVSSGFPTECQVCHNTTAWSPSSFNHATTGFALTGAHQTATCDKCHAAGYKGTPTDCYSCHQTNYAGVKDPNHVTNNFDHNCLKCHTTTAWLPVNFDHSGTSFPLTGAHTAVSCNTCHKTGFAGTPSTCYSCHQTNFTGVADPNHVTNNFDHNCLKCHTTTAWLPVSFDHSTTTFPLTGAHVAVTCNTCHKAGFAGTASTCYACHQTAYAGTTKPNHQASGFPTECQVCHNTTAWTPASFNHATTGFALTGAHQSVTCVKCHASGYKGTPTDCYSCHQTKYTGVTDPNHVTNNFDHDCTKCHSITAWSPATFNHSTTSFPLTGAHSAVTCIQCHSKGYAGTPTACYSCHAGDFAGASSPSHSTNNFDHDCTKCHSTAAWSPSTFNHSATVFPLTGAHLTVTCVQCHSTGYAGGTPTACYSCHAGNFAGVADPNHVTNNFNHDCTKCHSMTAWKPATFNHGATVFPLTGAHLAVSCIQCHSKGYAGTPTDCYSCHAGNFTGVADPNHVTGNFSHVCTNCHTTTAWTPATFNHNLSSFPLTGAHVSVTCVRCHKTGYTGTPATCDACHHTDYTGTSNPSHAAAAFPTTCQSCHTTTAWSPSTWNHDSQYFPIYSRTHKGRWSTCADCHINPASFATFECILCHTHSKSVTDSHHRSVRNYQYLSTACYRCHPKGGGG